MFAKRDPYASEAELDAERRLAQQQEGMEEKPEPGSGLVPRDPYIPERPGESESRDKIALFKGERLEGRDAPQGVEVKARHSVLLECLDEEAERQAEERQQAQIDDDYYHHQQWTTEDARVLQLRGQAPLVFNEARSSIDWLCGTERQLRKDYKIRPREKNDEQGAELKTKLVKYVEDVNNAPWHRSLCFKQTVTSGLGWLEVGINLDPEKELLYYGSEDWRRIYRDSRARDFALDDCRYNTRRKIIDLDYAQALLPGSARHLAAIAGRWGAEDDETDDVWYLGQRLTSAHSSAWAATSDSLFGEDYTVRRSGSAWDYGRRNTVEILEMWYRVPEVVKVFAAGPQFRRIVNAQDPRHQQLVNDRHPMYETVKMRMRCMVGTKYMPCWDGPSPYSHGKFPFIPMWGYRRGRDGLAYGSMRGMRDPQDDLNKRRSKALYALSATRTLFKKSTFDDIEDARSELARVDAMVEVSDINDVKIEQSMSMDQVRGNLELAQADIEHIRNAGGVTGENLGQNTRAQSGKAIIAKQEQGGLVTYELFDNFFLAFKLAGQLLLSNMEQFCNQEWVVRIDPEGMKPAEWVTANKLDPRTGQFLNDITAAQADFIVDKQDYRAVLSQAAMESMFELLTAMAQFAPQVVLNLLDLVVDSSDVQGKDEWVARIRRMTGQRDPSKPPTPEEQQADAERQAKEKEVEQVTIDTAKAKLEEIRAKITGTNATKVLTNLQALLSAVEAAATVVTMPGVAPSADALARAAGFEDQTPNDAVVLPPAGGVTRPEKPEPGSGFPADEGGFPAQVAQPPAGVQH